MQVVDIEDWDQVVTAFRAFFSGAGRVEACEQRVSFASCAPAVKTTFSLERDGRFTASMPLHDLAMRAVALDFDVQRAEVNLLGEGGVDYIYRMPPELLAAWRTPRPLSSNGN